MSSTPTENTLNLQFRIATGHDVKHIVDLVQSAYRGESSRAGWTTEADFIDGTRTDLQEVSDIINTPDNFILLCAQTNQLLASIHLQKQANTAYLGMFAVNPAMQNTGIGKSLLHAAETMVQQQWQCDRIHMTVITLRDELISWYARRGYRRTGIFKSFPYGQPRYGFPKREDLLLEVLEKILCLT